MAVLGRHHQCGLGQRHQQLHGLLYEFIRNTDLNAAGFFKPTLIGSTGTSVPFQKPTFNRNQFGMNFGGPILKNKFFFFLDYEGFRQTLTSALCYTLPTQNEINGILVVPVKNPDYRGRLSAGTCDPRPAPSIRFRQDHQLLQTVCQPVADFRRRHHRPELR